MDYHKAGKISFKYVKTFNMDEYVGEFNELIDTHSDSHSQGVWRGRVACSLL